MSSKPLITIAGEHRFELEVKKSRFLAIAVPVSDPDEAGRERERVSDAEATHNCWAYRIGEQYRFFDDGEPGGSAGRPILAAIEGQGIDHVLVVVTRWFGGTKLGVGGLVRAYGGACAECLRTAPRLEVRPVVELAVEVAFEDIGTLYPLVERFDGHKKSESYSDTGLDMIIELEEARVERFEAELRDATRGRAVTRLRSAT